MCASIPAKCQRGSPSLPRIVSGVRMNVSATPNASCNVSSASLPTIARSALRARRTGRCFNAASASLPRSAACFRHGRAIGRADRDYLEGHRLVQQHRRLPPRLQPGRSRADKGRRGAAGPDDAALGPGAQGHPAPDGRPGLLAVARPLARFAPARPGVRPGGLRRIRRHDCRHSFASQLVTAGVPLRRSKRGSGIRRST